MHNPFELGETADVTSCARFLQEHAASLPSHTLARYKKHLDSLLLSTSNHMNVLTSERPHLAIPGRKRQASHQGPSDVRLEQQQEEVVLFGTQPQSSSFVVLDDSSDLVQEKLLTSVASILLSNLTNCRLLLRVSGDVLQQVKCLNLKNCMIEFRLADRLEDQPLASCNVWLTKCSKSSFSLAGLSVHQLRLHEAVACEISYDTQAQRRIPIIMENSVDCRLNSLDANIMAVNFTPMSGG